MNTKDKYFKNQDKQKHPMPVGTVIVLCLLVLLIVTLNWLALKSEESLSPPQQKQTIGTTDQKEDLRTVKRSVFG